MARMHARRKGKSGSTRPYVSSNPDWVPIQKDEIEELVASHAKEGLSSSEIGIKLRDQYGVPNIKLATGKSVMDICKEKNVAPKMPDDLMNLLKTAVKMIAHTKENPRDLHNKRGLHLTESKIRRLAKYYKRQGDLPEKWKYNRSDARLMVE
ncbi:MAG: 30S ribosomal protein S15 [Thermoplasmata archaeon]|nr:30S ribosomal protein S15 [Thermoplasmata archaeon]